MARVAKSLLNGQAIGYDKIRRFSLMVSVPRTQSQAEYLAMKCGQFAVISGLFFALSLTRAATAATGGTAGKTAAGLAFFEAKIRPVLVEKCYSCHSSGADELKAGLHLDSRAGILKGGDSGPAAIPGNAADSLIVQALITGSTLF